MNDVSDAALVGKCDLDSSTSTTPSSRRGMIVAHRKPMRLASTCPDEEDGEASTNARVDATPTASLSTACCAADHPARWKRRKLKLGLRAVWRSDQNVDANGTETPAGGHDAVSFAPRGAQSGNASPVPTLAPAPNAHEVSSYPYPPGAMMNLYGEAPTHAEEDAAVGYTRRAAAQKARVASGGSYIMAPCCFIGAGGVGLRWTLFLLMALFVGCADAVVSWHSAAPSSTHISAERMTRIFFKFTPSVNLDQGDAITIEASRPIWDDTLWLQSGLGTTTTASLSDTVTASTTLADPQHWLCWKSLRGGAAPAGTPVASCDRAGGAQPTIRDDETGASPTSARCGEAGKVSATWAQAEENRVAWIECMTFGSAVVPVGVSESTSIVLGSATAKMYPTRCALWSSTRGFATGVPMVEMDSASGSFRKVKVVFDEASSQLASNVEYTLMCTEHLRAHAVEGPVRFRVKSDKETTWSPWGQGYRIAKATCPVIATPANAEPVVYTDSSRSSGSKASFSCRSGYGLTLYDVGVCQQTEQTPFGTWRSTASLTLLHGGIVTAAVGDTLRVGQVARDTSCSSNTVTDPTNWICWASAASGASVSAACAAPGAAGLVPVIAASASNPCGGPGVAKAVWGDVSQVSLSWMLCSGAGSFTAMCGTAGASTATVNVATASTSSILVVPSCTQVPCARLPVPNLRAIGQRVPSSAEASYAVSAPPFARALSRATFSCANGHYLRGAPTTATCVQKGNIGAWLSDGPAIVPTTVLVNTMLVSTALPSSGQWLCWRSNTAAAVDAECGVVGTGSVSISSASTGARSVCSLPGVDTALWQDATQLRVAVIACIGNDTPVGISRDVFLSTSPIIAPAVQWRGQAITYTRALGAGHYLCWSGAASSSATPVATCGTIGAPNFVPSLVGPNLCGGQDVTTATWGNAATAPVKVAVAQCSTAQVLIGRSVDVRMTLRESAITPTTAMLGSILTARTRMSAPEQNWLCWKSHASVTPTATCTDASSVVGDVPQITAGSSGTATVCGGRGVTSSVWSDVSQVHIAVIECAGVGAGTPIGGSQTPSNRAGNYMPIIHGHVLQPTTPNSDVSIEARKFTGSVSQTISASAVGAGNFLCWRTAPSTPSPAPLATCTVSGGSSPVIVPARASAGDVIAHPNVGASHYLCWRSDTDTTGVSSPTAACETAAGTGSVTIHASATGARSAVSVCGATNVPTALWADATQVQVAVIECSGIGTPIRVQETFLMTVGYPVVPLGPSASAAVCGAVGDATARFEGLMTNIDHVSVIECSGVDATAVGVATRIDVVAFSSGSDPFTHTVVGVSDDPLSTTAELQSYVTATIAVSTTLANEINWLCWISNSATAVPSFCAAPGTRSASRIALINSAVVTCGWPGEREAKWASPSQTEIEVIECTWGSPKKSSMIAVGMSTPLRLTAIAVSPLVVLEGDMIATSRAPADNNWLCWETSTGAAVTATCLSQGTSIPKLHASSTGAGTSVCGQAAKNSAYFHDATQVRIAVVECSAAGSAVVSSVHTDITVGHALSPTRASPGALISSVGVLRTSAHWLCWRSSTGTDELAICAAPSAVGSDVVSISAETTALRPVCGEPNVLRAVWSDPTQIRVAVIECSNAGAAYGVSASVKMTQTEHLAAVPTCAIATCPIASWDKSALHRLAPVKFTVGRTHDSVARFQCEPDYTLSQRRAVRPITPIPTNANDVVTRTPLLESSNHLCWRSGQSGAQPVATCAAAVNVPVSISAGTTGASSICGASSVLTAIWSEITEVAIAVIECSSAGFPAAGGSARISSGHPTAAWATPGPVACTQTVPGVSASGTWRLEPRLEENAIANAPECVAHATCPHDTLWISDTNRYVALSTTVAITLASGDVLVRTAPALGNWLCWRSAALSATLNAAVQSDCTSAGLAEVRVSGGSTGSSGAVVCGALNVATAILIELTEVQISVIECSNVNVAAGSSYETVLPSSAGMLDAIYPTTATMGTTLTARTPLTNPLNWLCWKSGASGTVTATCGSVSTTASVVSISDSTTRAAPVCGISGAITAIWNDASQRIVAVIECRLSSSSVRSSSMVSMFEGHGEGPQRLSVTSSVESTLVAPMPLADPSNYFCWTSSDTVAATPSCSGVGSAVVQIKEGGTSGTPVCGSAGVVTAMWAPKTLDRKQIHVNVIQCTSAPSSAVGAHKALHFNIGVRMHRIVPTTVIPGSFLSAGGKLASALNWLCWKSDTNTDAIASCSTAGAAGTTPIISATAPTLVCGGPGLTTAQWAHSSRRKVAVIECAGNMNAVHHVGISVGVTITPTFIVTWNGGGTAIVPTVASAGETLRSAHEVGAGNWLCWKSSTSGSSGLVAASCGSVGTVPVSIESTTTGSTSVCGAADVATATWLETAQRTVAVVQCTSPGASVAIASDFVTVSTSATTLTASADVDATSWLCWRSGGTPPSATAICGVSTSNSPVISSSTTGGSTFCGPTGESSATWSASTPTQLYVSAIKCAGSPPAPVGAAVSTVIAIGSTAPVSNSLHGTSAVFSCALHYALSHTNALTCAQVGASSIASWNGALPSCLRATCPVLNIPAGVHLTGVTYTDGQNIDSEASFGCDSGYLLSPAGPLTCIQVGTSPLGKWSRQSQSGVWQSNPLPTCASRLCPMLTPVSGSEPPAYSNGLTHGSQASFACADGYHARASGWIPSRAGQSCDATCLEQPSTLVCDESRLRAVDTLDKLKTVNNAVGLQCNGYAVDSSNTNVPLGPVLGSSGTCYFSSTPQAVCADKPAASARMCCCATAAERTSGDTTLRALCPVEATDCRAGTTWDAHSGRCLATATGDASIGSWLYTAPGSLSSSAATVTAVPTCSLATCTAAGWSADANRITTPTPIVSTSASQVTFECMDSYYVSGPSALICVQSVRGISSWGMWRADSVEYVAPICIVAQCPLDVLWRSAARIVVATTANGGIVLSSVNGVNELSMAGAVGPEKVQTVTIGATSGTWDIGFDGETTTGGALTAPASAAAVQAALEGLSSIGSGNVGSVTLDASVTDTSTYTITFKGTAAGHHTVAFSGYNVPQVTAVSHALAGGVQSVSSMTVETNYWLCWKSSTAAVDAPTCETAATAGSIVSINAQTTGATQCGPPNTFSAQWTDSTQVFVAARTCKGHGAGGQLVPDRSSTVSLSSGGVTPSIAQGGATLTSVTPLAHNENYLCWRSTADTSTSVPSIAECGASNSAAVAIGSSTSTSSACGAKRVRTATWSDTSETKVAVIECTGVQSPAAPSVLTVMAVGTPVLPARTAPHGTTATFSCSTGYTLSSTLPLVCKQAGASRFGKWVSGSLDVLPSGHVGAVVSGLPPTCGGLACVSLPGAHTWSRLNMVSIISEPEGTAVATVATITCRPGYFVSGEASNLVVLECGLQDATGMAAEWQYSGTTNAAVVPKCALAQCAALTTGENAVAPSFSLGGSHGSRATFECIEGYFYAVGLESAVCMQIGTSNIGQWRLLTTSGAIVSQTPACQPVSCSIEASTWPSDANRAPVVFNLPLPPYSAVTPVVLSAGDTVTVLRTLQSTANYLCWSSGTNGASPTTSCGAAGSVVVSIEPTSTGAGFACGAPGVDYATWTDVQQVELAVTECSSPSTSVAVSTSATLHDASLSIAPVHGVVATFMCNTGYTLSSFAPLVCWQHAPNLELAQWHANAVGKFDPYTVRAGATVRSNRMVLILTTDTVIPALSKNILVCSSNIAPNGQPGSTVRFQMRTHGTKDRPSDITSSTVRYTPTVAAPTEFVSVTPASLAANAAQSSLAFIWQAGANIGAGGTVMIASSAPVWSAGATPTCSCSQSSAVVSLSGVAVSADLKSIVITTAGTISSLSQNTVTCTSGLARNDGAGYVVAFQIKSSLDAEFTPISMGTVRYIVAGTASSPASFASAVPNTLVSNAVPTSLVLRWKPAAGVDQGGSTITVTSDYPIWAAAGLSTTCTCMRADATAFGIASVTVAYDKLSLGIKAQDAATLDGSYTYDITCASNFAPNPGVGTVVHFQIRTDRSISYKPIELMLSAAAYTISGVATAPAALTGSFLPSNDFGTTPTSVEFTLTPTRLVSMGNTVTFTFDGEFAVWVESGFGTSCSGATSSVVLAGRKSLVLTLAAALSVETVITCTSNIARLPTVTPSTFSVKAKTHADILYSALAGITFTGTYVEETSLTRVTPDTFVGGVVPTSITFAWYAASTIPIGATMKITSNVPIWAAADATGITTDCTMLQARGAPTCSLATCAQLQAPQHGSFVLTDGNNHGSVATFSCDEYYYLAAGERDESQNTALRTCAQSDASSVGTWSGAIALCKMAKCPVLTSPMIGVDPQYSDVQRPGSIATFACPAGFYSAEHMPLRCYQIGRTASGEWRRDTQNTGTFTAPAPDALYPTCMRVKCPVLSAPEFGSSPVLTDELFSGSVASFVCDAGYTVDFRERTTGWLKAGVGETCDFACSAGRRCDSSRIAAISSDNAFTTANTAIGAEFSDGRADRSGFICNVKVSSSATEYPGKRADSCYYRAGGTASCSASSLETARLCCCIMLDENADTMCPLAASDCGPDTTWDDATKRCVPSLTGDTFRCVQGVTVSSIRGITLSNPVYEVQTVTIGATGGTWDIAFDGQSTTGGALTAPASAEDVQAALEGLSNIGVGSVGTVVLDASTAAVQTYAITFTGSTVATSGNVAQVSPVPTALTGGTQSVESATRTNGDNAGQLELKWRTLRDIPSGGTITMASDEAIWGAFGPLASVQCTCAQTGFSCVITSATVSQSMRAVTITLGATLLDTVDSTIVCVGARRTTGSTTSHLRLQVQTSVDAGTVLSPVGEWMGDGVRTSTVDSTRKILTIETKTTIPPLSDNTVTCDGNLALHPNAPSTLVRFQIRTSADVQNNPAILSSSPIAYEVGRRSTTLMSASVDILTALSTPAKITFVLQIAEELPAGAPFTIRSDVTVWVASGVTTCTYTHNSVLVSLSSAVVSDDMLRITFTAGAAFPAGVQTTVECTSNLAANGGPGLVVEFQLSSSTGGLFVFSAPATMQITGSTTAPALLQVAALQPGVTMTDSRCLSGRVALSASSGSWLCWRSAQTGSAPAATCAVLAAKSAVSISAATTGASGSLVCGFPNVFTATWTQNTQIALSIIKCSESDPGSAVAGSMFTGAAIALVPPGALLIRRGSAGNWLCWRSASVAPAPQAVCGGVGTGVVSISAGTTGGTTLCGIADTFTATWTETTQGFVSVAECSSASTEVATPKQGTAMVKRRTLVHSGTTGNWLCWRSGSSAGATPPAVCSQVRASIAHISSGTSGPTAPAPGPVCGPVGGFSATWSGPPETHISVIECGFSGSISAALSLSAASISTIGAALLSRGISIAGNWLCWRSGVAGVTPPAATCKGAGAGIVNVAQGTTGASGSNVCGSMGDTSARWLDTREVTISIIECTTLGVNTPVSGTAFSGSASALVGVNGRVLAHAVRAGNWLCWRTGLLSSTSQLATCAAAGTAGVSIDISTGTTGTALTCGAIGEFTARWIAVTEANVWVVECTDVAGAATQVATSIASASLATSAPLVSARTPAAGNWLCWRSGTSTVAPTATCPSGGGAGPTVSIAAATTGAGLLCGPSGVATALWADCTEISISVIECGGSGAVSQATAHASAALVPLHRRILTYDVSSGNWLCWRSSLGTAVPTATCGAVGLGAVVAASSTTGAAGASVCGAAGVTTAVWVATTETRVSIVECRGVGIHNVARAPQEMDSASLLLTDKLILSPTVSALTPGNWLCWRSALSASAPSAVCAPAGSPVLITSVTTGTNSVCGPIDDGSAVWYDTTHTYISVVECQGIGGGAMAVDSADLVMADGRVITKPGTPGNWLCWRSGAVGTARTAVCSDPGSAGVAISALSTGAWGAVQCGPTGVFRASWDDTSERMLSVVECTGSATAVAAPADFRMNSWGIARPAVVTAALVPEQIAFVWNPSADYATNGAVITVSSTHPVWNAVGATLCHCARYDGSLLTIVEATVSEGRTSLSAVLGSSVAPAVADGALTLTCTGNSAPHPGAGSVVRFQLRTSVEVLMSPSDVLTSTILYSVSGRITSLASFSVTVSPLSPLTRPVFGAAPDYIAFSFTPTTTIPSGGSVSFFMDAMIWSITGSTVITRDGGSSGISAARVSNSGRSLTVWFDLQISAGANTVITSSADLAPPAIPADGHAVEVRCQAVSSMDVARFPVSFSDAAANQRFEFSLSATDHAALFATSLVSVRPSVVDVSAAPGSISFRWRSSGRVLKGGEITITSDTQIWNAAYYENPSMCTSVAYRAAPTVCLGKECPTAAVFDPNWVSLDGNDRIVFCDPVQSPSGCAGRMETHAPSRRFPHALATYFCSAGYTLEGNAAANPIVSFSRACNAVGADWGAAVGQSDPSWSLSSPTCVPRICPTLPTPLASEHVTIAYSRSTLFYQVPTLPQVAASYRCDEGFFGGTGTRTCSVTIGMQSSSTETVTWTPHILDNTGVLRSSCQATACPEQPLTLERGTVTWSDPSAKRNWHSEENYVCDLGYVLIGPRVRRCEDDRSDDTEVGAWSYPSPPQCVPAKCGSLEFPANGYVTYSSPNPSYAPVGGTAPALVATYHCHWGLVLDGTQTRQCNAVGRWTAAEKPTPQVRGFVGWSIAQPPQCNPVECVPFNTAWLGLGVEKSAPFSILDVDKIVDWMNPQFGDQLAFNCSDPRALTVGPKSPTCTLSGTWLSGLEGNPSGANPIQCECPAGMTMIIEVRDNARHTALDFGKCEICPQHTFNPFSGTRGIGACQLCNTDGGFRAEPGSIVCYKMQLTCPDGTYKNKQGVQCNSCPDFGAICTENTLTLLPEWWFDQAWVDAGHGRDGELTGDTEMWECLSEDACITDAANVTVTCAEGYYGPMCGACDLHGKGGGWGGGYMRSGITCRKCDAWWLNIFVVMYMAGTYVNYIFYVVAFQDFASESDQRPVVLKITMSFAQMLSVLGVFKARGTAVFNEVVQRPAKIAGGGVSSIVNLKCFLNDQLYSTFMLDMLTPLIAAGLTIVLIMPVYIIKQVEWAIIHSAPPARPPREVTTLLLKQRTILGWERGIMQKELDMAAKERFKPVSRFIAVLVFVLFGVYPTLVSSIFTIFRCTDAISGKRYLDDDLTIECYKGLHPTFMAIAIMFGFVYLVGIPFGLGAILQFNRHRLKEAGFQAKFGFIYTGYDLDRGMVSAWESFVMVRKLAVTAITIATSDPYLQIFLALLLLITSYGIQERVKPYSVTHLNLLEGAALFSLIFTQVVSILFLYIDAESKATGKADKPLEYSVTVILIMANAIIIVAMLSAYVNAFRAFKAEEALEFVQFIEERDEPFGVVTNVANPHLAVQEQLYVYRADVNVEVFSEPYFGSESTGEIMEEGELLVVIESLKEYAREQKCCAPGRYVEWHNLRNGSGWVVDRNMETGKKQLRLVGREDDDGTLQQSYWRFNVVSTEPVPIRCGTSSDPFVWDTGEVLNTGESVLVDKRILRLEGYCGAKREVTFLHLADRRGWVVEVRLCWKLQWAAQPPPPYLPPSFSPSCTLSSLTPYNSLSASEQRSFSPSCTLFSLTPYHSLSASDTVTLPHNHRVAEPCSAYRLDCRPHLRGCECAALPHWPRSP